MEASKDDVRSADYSPKPGLKAFTIITGEPKRIDCYLEDKSLSLYWAKSKKDVIAHLIRTQDSLLTAIPLSRSSDYSHTPSDHHIVLCTDDSCPCKKYVMCWNCECTKEAVPTGGIKLPRVEKYDGEEEELTDDNDEPGCCQCETPNFQQLDKIKMISNAIDSYCDSDHCFKLIELAIQEPILEDGKNASPAKKSRVS